MSLTIYIHSFPIACASCRIISNTFNKDIDYIFEDANALFISMIGDVKEKSAKEALSVFEKEYHEWNAFLKKALRTQSTQKYFYFSVSLRKWYHIHFSPFSPDQFYILIDDVSSFANNITKASGHEKAIKENLTLEHLNFELTRINNEYLALNEEYIAQNEQMKFINHELHLKNENLLQNEERYNHLFDNMLDAVVLWESENNGENFLLRSINKTAEIIEGISKENAERKKITELFPECIENGYFKLLENVFKTKKTEHIHNFYYTSKKRSSWRNYYIYTLETGEIVSIYKDITSFRRSQEMLRMSETRYKSVFENISDVYYETTIDGVLLDISPSIEKISGYKRDELLGRPLLDFYTYHEERSEIIKVLLERKSISNYEITLTDKNNRIVPCSVTAYIVNDHNNHPVVICGILRDISEKKKAETELRESEEKYRHLAENISQGIYSVHNGRFIDFNNSLMRIFGYSKVELLQMHPWELALPEKQNETKNIFLTKLDKQDYSPIDIECITKSGKIITTKIDIREIKREDKSYTYGTVTDISKQKEEEIALHEALRKAEENDKLKSAFIANISHEIRTPMNAMLGFAQLLKNPKHSTEKKQEYVQIINDAGKDLLNIINDIIDISKIEAGQLVIDKAPVDLCQMLTDLFNLFNPLADKKKIVFEKQCTKKSENIIFLADELRVRQILSNLINNALKFTQDGKVIFGVKLHENMIAFNVEDTGIGIAEENLKIIFDRFRQANSDISRKYGGTGLGLAISKHLANIMGGKIEVRSEINIGSVFSLILPYEKAEVIQIETARVDNEEKQADLNGVTILIVEDEHVNFLFIRELLDEYNLTLLNTKNGNEAINICLQNKNIDLILMDLKLPGISGIETTRIIKNEYPHIPIIAVTANAYSSDRIKAMEAGCVDYLTKPFQADSLLFLIRKYLT